MSEYQIYSPLFHVAAQPYCRRANKFVQNAARRFHMEGHQGLTLKATKISIGHELNTVWLAHWHHTTALSWVSL